jgi:uncharacterized DUF497 family protein
MALLFAWDPQKATTNVAKHGVTFDEASTVFQDTLSATIGDPLHSEDEDRFVLIGHSHRNRILVVVHTERGDRIRLVEYDFSEGVRGKYAKRYAEGTNVVVLDPDVAEYFRDHQAVNDSLRSLIGIIRR